MLESPSGELVSQKKSAREIWRVNICIIIIPDAIRNDDSRSRVTDHGGRFISPVSAERHPTSVRDAAFLQKRVRANSRVLGAMRVLGTS